MRRMVSLAALTLLLGFPLVQNARSVHASSGGHSYLSYAACSSPRTSQDVQARFIVPGPTDLLAQFGVLPANVWIDLSLFDNGFAPGTFVGAGPFPIKFAGGYEFQWDHLIPGQLHYYRLNGLFGDSWMEIGRGVFETPDCGSILGVYCYGEIDGTASVDFRLFPAVGVPEQRWLDLSFFDNDFAPATFIGAGPFGRDDVQFRWMHLVSARRHFFRVNVLYANGEWHVQAESRGSVLTPDCRNLATIFPLRT